MDYQVFLVSRTRARYDRNGDNDEAVSARTRQAAGALAAGR